MHIVFTGICDAVASVRLSSYSIRYFPILLKTVLGASLVSVTSEQKRIFKKNANEITSKNILILTKC